MYPLDPTSTRQLLDAELLVDLQHRDGTVVSHHSPRRRALGRRIAAWRHAGPLPATHELFAGLSRTQLRRAARFFTVVDVPAGSELGTQGAPVEQFVTILEGRVGVTIDGVPHAVLDDGSQFSGLSLLDDERPTERASFNVMAQSRVAVVDAAQFPAMLQELPIIAARIRAIADVRRAYLAGRTATAEVEPAGRRWIEIEEYPVHLSDEMVARRLGLANRRRTHHRLGHRRNRAKQRQS